MAVLQMQRISICALKHDRKAILEKLQSMGMIEMHQVRRTKPDSRRWIRRVPNQASRNGCRSRKTHWMY